MSLSLAVDAGGTFTDLVLTDTADGRTWIAKTPSASDPTEAVPEGIAKVCDAGGASRARRVRPAGRSRPFPRVQALRNVRHRGRDASGRARHGRARRVSGE